MQCLNFSTTRIEFLDVILSNPALGECTNDTLTITNIDPVSAAIVPTPLCGTLTGSESNFFINTFLKNSGER